MSPATLEADIEQAALDIFASMTWSTANVMYETVGENGTLGRENKGEVVLLRRLRPALEKLNPDLPADAIDDAIEELTRDRSAMGLVRANREVYDLLKRGVPVRVSSASEEDERDVTVKVIDWATPTNNDFFVAQQLWVQGEIYAKRADLVGFVNGLPLVFVELKGIQLSVEAAYEHNVRDYLGTIPKIFWFNAVIIVSNGFENRVGTITAVWEHFKPWKRIEREDEEPRVALEVILRGICAPQRLLDLVENFTLFSEVKSGVAKIVGQNHQYLGVNNALEAVRKYQLASQPPSVSSERLAERRRLGVFWHTQGSGKSFSMVFFSQKILRKVPGAWTFVIVTDREDLDDQIYKTFVSCGAVPPAGKSDKSSGPRGVQAKTAEHLRQLLREDHSYVFTLIQKFRTNVKGETYPKLSDRSDIIVIADEAHRSQYDTFAMNLRSALPNAAFIGFTGTPLMAGEEKTREVFGDYVSIYNFRQAIEDQATVPLYYEARIPELQLTNEQLADELTDLVDEADLDEDQQKKLEREFARQYHLVTREDRLDTIAADIVDHFLGLPTGTKAMVVAIDKLTAVRMYNKVTAAWHERLAGEKKQAAQYNEPERAAVQARIKYMEETDFAVVVSAAQNEADTFAKKGLDITVHRRRMVDEDLDTKFKDHREPLRMVFVCAMWMTGFDVPSCGAVYLDKPMRNHTLMQTIARANRVFEGKESGLIVDYIGVFRNLQKALAIYGAGGIGGTPVQPKEVQLAELASVISEAKAFCTAKAVDFEATKTTEVLRRLQKLKDGVDKLVHPAEVKKAFLELASRVDRLYRAVGADERKKVHSLDWGVIVDLAARLRALDAPVDISHVMERVEKLFDASIDAYFIRQPTTGAGRVHLGSIDFEALARFFKNTKNKATTVEAAKASAKKRVDDLVRLNPTRVSFRERLDQLIADYNAGAEGVEDFFKKLLVFMKKLEEEEGRGPAEGLDEERLALYDIVVAAVPALSDSDRKAVKMIAAEVPDKIKKKLVIDWRKNQRSRAAAKVAIKSALDELPGAYDDVFENVVEAVYDHVFESYWGEGGSKYVEAKPKA